MRNVLRLLPMVLIASLLPPPGAADAPLPVALDALEVQVDWQDMVAVTTVEATLRNPNADARETLFSLPLARSAVLTNLTLTTPTRTYVGLVVEATAGQAVYNASREAGRDAVLVQSSGRGLLAVSINVATNETVQLSATYVELAGVEEGLQTYRFPLATFGADHDAIGRFRLEATIQLSHGWDSFEVEGVPGSAATVEDGNATIDYVAEPFEAGSDLSVEIQPSAQGYTSTLMISGYDASATFVAAVLPPGSGSTPLPLDVVFVLDDSGSMDGDKIVQAKEALQTILGQLRTQDRFGLVAFDSVIATYASSLESVDADAIGNAQAWVAARTADGGTNIEGALAKALDVLGDEETASLPTIVLITDGQPTEGITVPSDIIDSIREKNTLEARIHTVGIGFDQDDAFLTELAVSNRGFYEAVGPADDVSDELEDFYERIATPVLRDVTVTFEGLDALDVHPAPVPDVYQGSHLLLAGRADTAELPDEVVVTVSGRDASGPASFEVVFPTAELPVRPEVDRLWARQKANSLEREMALNDDSASAAALRAQLLALGLERQIATLATSWIVAPLDEVDVDAVTGWPELLADAQDGAAVTSGTYAVGVSVSGTQADPGVNAKKTPSPAWFGIVALAAVVVLLRRQQSL